MAHNTIHSATNVHNQKTGTTVFVTTYMVASAAGVQVAQHNNQCKQAAAQGGQPISFRSCEHTDQKAAHLASAPPGPLSRCEDEAHGDQAEGGQKQNKVEQTRVQAVQSQEDPASQRREEVGKLQEDRSKAVIAIAIPEATEAVEKASAEVQSNIAEVCEGSGKPSSRMSSQFEKSTEAILNSPQRRTSHRGSESEHVARHHAKRE